MSKDVAHGSLGLITGVMDESTYSDQIVRVWHRCHDQGKPLTIMVVHVDDFEDSDDHYGRRANDWCLGEVATVLRNVIPNEMGLVGRHGREDFLIILPEAGLGTAKRLAEQVRDGVSGARVPHLLSKAADFMTVSVWVSTFHPRTCSKIADLVLNALRALEMATYPVRDRVVLHVEG